MKNNSRIIEHPILKFERGERLRFQFNGRPVTAYEGETIAAALYADGIRIFSRSFKYHRPRGLYCFSGYCSHCLMRVDGVPNVRTCMELVRWGMKVESQNAWPSLKLDIAAFAGYLDFLIRPGFQYRRFIRQRRLYHIWERFLRRMAGVGKLADVGKNLPPRTMQAEPEVVIAGGGIAGISAALHAAGTGAKVWLIEKETMLGGTLCYDTSVVELPEAQTEQHGFIFAAEMASKVEELNGCHVLKNATAFAWYDEGVLAVSRPGELWELRPQALIVSTGSYENPMIFENNDLPGIFLAGGLRRLMHRDGIRPGRQAVVITNNHTGYTIVTQLLEAGVSVAGVADNRPKAEVSSHGAKHVIEAGVSVYPGYEIQAAIGRRHVKGVILRQVNQSRGTKPGPEIRLTSDVLVIAGDRTPANELVFQRTCQGAYILESQFQCTRRPVATGHLKVDRGLYVAGEANGGQGFRRAWLEGKVAGLSAALDLGYGEKKMEAERESAGEILAASPLT